jgi:hypothetical protein
MRPPVRIVLLSSLALLTGCIVEAPGGQSAAPERARAVVNNVPPLQLQVGANLEDKLELVGVMVQPGQVMPGESMKVTAYFRVIELLDTDYMVFVHADDPAGAVDRINADHRPAGGVYPTTQWKKGETVKDEFQVYVPPGMPVRALVLYMGLWDPKTDARMKLKNVDKVKSDGNNRIQVATVPVGVP